MAKKPCVWVVEARPVRVPDGDWLVIACRLYKSDAAAMARKTAEWRNQTAKQVRVRRYVPEGE